MWVARTGPYEAKPVVVFEYKRGRNHEDAYEIDQTQKPLFKVMDMRHMIN